jgi:Protein of unknown function (DUF998)
VLATTQYAIAQLVAASAWNPPYSWSNNYISDLGNTTCAMFAVPHAGATYVCSPLHPVMNSSFIIAGILTITGAALLNRLWPARQLTTIALVLWILAGLGKIVVGAVPGEHQVRAAPARCGQPADQQRRHPPAQPDHPTHPRIPERGRDDRRRRGTGRFGPLQRRPVRRLLALPRIRRGRNGTHRGLPVEPVATSPRHHRDPRRP